MLATLGTRGLPDTCWLEVNFGYLAPHSDSLFSASIARNDIAIVLQLAIAGHPIGICFIRPHCQRDYQVGPVSAFAASSARSPICFSDVSLCHSYTGDTD